jgi:hypothetical protein
VSNVKDIGGGAFEVQFSPSENVNVVVDFVKDEIGKK